MIACLDVDYRECEALAACVLASDWSVAAAAREFTTPIRNVASYAPGEFFRRELPCLLAALQHVAEPLDAIIVDGYVWLDAHGRPGLGARLYEAIHRGTPVIGVAKSAFAGSDFALPVLRGDSQRPLWVTAVGLDPESAANGVRAMHGPFRVPTLLKRVDQLCRGRATSSA